MPLEYCSHKPYFVLVSYMPLTIRRLSSNEALQYMTTLSCSAFAPYIWCMAAICINSEYLSWISYCMWLAVSAIIPPFNSLSTNDAKLERLLQAGEKSPTQEYKNKGELSMQYCRLGTVSQNFSNNFST